MDLSHWIWSENQFHIINKEVIANSLFEYCGRSEVPYSIFSEDGDLIAFNESFDKLNKDEFLWQSLVKKEILLMRSLSRQSIHFNQHVQNGEIEQLFDVKVFANQCDVQKLFICKIDEITELSKNEALILDMNYQLTQKIKEINDAQIKIMNQEKLVGIGQLAAGVAHEINNPLGFVKSNFRVLDDYFREITRVLLTLKNEIVDFKVHKENKIESDDGIAFFTKIEALIEESDYKYIIEDYEGLFKDTNIGLERVERIVTSLRKFSRVDHMMSFTEFNLNEGVEETLIIANNEIKYDAEVIKDMQYVPLTYAIAGEINQVILNILVNAVHAIKEKNINTRGIIKITTRSDDKYIYCEIMDNGIGIKNNDQDQIFVPFFTTKEVGKGTGLGMSIAYDIITNKHGGELSFTSEYGMGTTFKIKLPIHKVDTDTINDFMNTY